MQRSHPNFEGAARGRAANELQPRTVPGGHLEHGRNGTDGPGAVRSIGKTAEALSRGSAVFAPARGTAADAPARDAGDRQTVQFVTVCNDEFAPGLTVLLHSLRTHFRGFDEIPFRVIHHPRIAPLALATRTILGREFSNVSFGEPRSAAYFDAPTVNERADNSAYLTLEAFAPTARDRVLFIDSDMLALRDFSDILDIDHPFIACKSGGHPKQYRGPRYDRGMINTGLFAIGQEYLDGRTYEALLERARNNTSKLLRDQWVINSHVPIRDIHILPDTYNFQAWNHLAHFVSHARKLRTLHYSGYSVRPKPWAREAPVESLAYRIWVEAALDAVGAAPTLRKLLPELARQEKQLRSVIAATQTGRGILRNLEGDVQEDLEAERHLHGETTLNRIRALTPKWVSGLVGAALGTR